MPWFVMGFKQLEQQTFPWREEEESWEEEPQEEGRLVMAVLALEGEGGGEGEPKIEV